jgi:hypothetical protein
MKRLDGLILANFDEWNVNTASDLVFAAAARER